MKAMMFLDQFNQKHNVQENDMSNFKWLYNKHEFSKSTSINSSINSSCSMNFFLLIEKLCHKFGF